jgi:hypothetical protein
MTGEVVPHQQQAQRGQLFRQSKGFRQPVLPGFAVTGHTWTGAVPGKPQMSWLFAAAAAENTPKT